MCSRKGLVRKVRDVMETVRGTVRGTLAGMRGTGRRHRATLRLAAWAAAVGVVLAAGAVALAGPWDNGQRTAERRAAVERDAARSARGDQSPTGLAAVRRPAAPSALAPLGTGHPAAAPEATRLRRELDPLLTDLALGRRTVAAVVDVATGGLLYGRQPDAGATPASTVKLVTAVAALHTLGPDHRLTTSAVWDAERGRVVLVGGGDPTLGTDDLRRLATRAAGALRDRGETAVRVGYDTSLYGQEQLHRIGVNANLALVTPLQVNAGRLNGSDHGPAPRSTDPAADAAAAFAAHLADAGLTVTGRVPAERTAPRGAVRVAAHRSAPLSALVERVLTESDNDLAEALARHTAAATGHRPGFDGVTGALTAHLADLGLPLDGVRLADASGLDRTGELTPRLLARLLALAADPRHPELRPVLTGMPVAGFTGTLSDRYDGAGAGVVRAKTGTLTGVNALAGTVITPAGRVLAFAFLASGAQDPDAAEAALDRAAGALATCVCGARPR